MGMDYLDLEKLYAFQDDDDMGGDQWERPDDDQGPDEDTENFL